MKTTNTSQGASALAGIAAAFVCSGIWLGIGLFVMAFQGGGVA